MTEKINLNEIEKKAFISYWQDGLLEIMLGYILLISTLSSILMTTGVPDSIRIPIYIPLMILVPAPLFILAKKYITMPRLGYVKFGEKRKRDRKKFIIFAIILNIFIIITLIATITNSLHRFFDFLGISSNLFFPLFILGFVFLIFAFLVYLFNVPRFYFLGLLMGSTTLINTCLKLYTTFPHRGLIAYGLPGLILLVMGIIILNRFLQKYPKVSEELNNV